MSFANLDKNFMQKETLRRALLACALALLVSTPAHAASVDGVLGSEPLAGPAGSGGSERVLILEESFPDASLTQDRRGEKPPALVVAPVKEAAPSSSKPGPKPEVKPVPKPSPKPENVKPPVKKAEAPVEEKKAAPEKLDVPAQALAPAQPSDYEVMSDMQRALMVLQLRQKLMSVQTGIAKNEAEQTKLQKEMVADDLMNFRLGPPGKGMSLPVIPASQVPAAPVSRVPDRAENAEPPLRVVGIQGYDGVFSAQILNNGGLVSVEPGTEIEGGIQILSINESGVKVRKTVERNGEKKEEIVTLPFSR